MKVDYLVWAAILGYVFYKFLWPIIKIMMHGNIILNKSSKLTDEEYKKVSVSSIYAAQQAGFLNSVETGITNVPTILNEWWGIYNKADAENTIDMLLNGGDRCFFDAAYKAVFETKSDEEMQNMILNSLKNGEDVEKAISRAQNLKSCFDKMVELKIIEDKETIKSSTSAGWDFGRATFLARICYDHGLFTEDEAWEYINKSYDLTKKTFKDWKTFANSYVVGRIMWGGTNTVNDGMNMIADDLTTNELSPWVKMPL
ncbi:MAG: DUF1266 domain-containing protein [Alphaproteobacteria bacterium]